MIAAGFRVTAGRRMRSPPSFRKVSVLAAPAVALLLASCGTAGQAGSARPETAPADYREQVLAVARSYVNNPHRIRDAGITAPMLKSVGRGERYIVCVRFNAMDMDGKYTGAKARVARFRHGKLEQFSEDVVEPDAPKTGTLFQQPPESLCKGVTYLPFPELEKL
jgi:hypothetical protein